MSDTQTIINFITNNLNNVTFNGKRAISDAGFQSVQIAVCQQYKGFALRAACESLGLESYHAKPELAVGLMNHVLSVTEHLKDNAARSTYGNPDHKMYRQGFNDAQNSNATEMLTIMNKNGFTTAETTSYRCGWNAYINNKEIAKHVKF